MVAPLPLQFSQCFSSDQGLAQLHAVVLAALVEDERLQHFLRSNATAYRVLARDLLGALPVQSQPDSGFNASEGGSLKRAYFAGVLASAHRSGTTYRKTALELEKLVDAFAAWAEQHAAAVTDAKDQVSLHIASFQKGLKEVQALKQAYDNKCLDVEELEDENNFHAPAATSKLPPLAIPAALTAHKKSPGALMSPADNEELTPTDAQPRTSDAVLGPHPTRTTVSRKVSLSDRLKALTRDATGSPQLTSVSEDPAAVPDDPSILEIGGIKNAPQAWSSIFSRAVKSLPKRTLKIPLIGTYGDVHSGEDLLAWFKENLAPLEGDYLQTLEFCRQLSEELLILRLVGEIGNRFQDSSDAYYQFRPEAFHLDSLGATPSPERSAEPDHFTRLPAPASPRLRPTSPDPPKSPNVNGTTLLKRSGTILSTISAAFTPAPPSVKLQNARQEAYDAATAYRSAVRRTELLRMRRDEQVEHYLNFLQHAQYQRLQYLKATLGRYQLLVSSVQPSAGGNGKDNAADEVQMLIESIKPEADIEALCEMHRLEGSYRPRPVVFHDHYGETCDALFGGDLVRWQEAQVHAGKKPGEVGVPPVLATMLEYIKQGYGKLAKPSDKRRIWYLEIPLASSHRLRQALNDPRASSSSSGVPTNLLKQSDIAVVASVVKLFFLDLENPVVPFALYDHVRKLYPSLGAADADEAGKVAALKDLMSQLPRLHLLVLDALLQHIQELMVSTRSESDEKVDSDDVYLAKVGYSLGRCIARPKEDTAVTINDRAPIYLFADLVRHRDQVLPEAIAIQSKKEVERFRAPIRKRTRPVDVRMSRSKLGSEQINAEQAQTILEEQLHQKQPKRSSTQQEPEPVPAQEPIKQDALPALPEAQAEPALPLSAGRSGANTPDPPFATPGEEAEDQLAAGSTTVTHVEPPKQASPVPLPHTLAAPRTSAHEDPPFVPPTEPEDPPFSPPTEEDTSLGSIDLSRSSSGSNPLLRAPRVSRGPRKLEEAPIGRVAAAAQRWSMTK